MIARKYILFLLLCILEQGLQGQSFTADIELLNNDVVYEYTDTERLIPIVIAVRIRQESGKCQTKQERKIKLRGTLTLTAGHLGGANEAPAIYTVEYEFDQPKCSAITKVITWNVPLPPDAPPPAEPNPPSTKLNFLVNVSDGNENFKPRADTTSVTVRAAPKGIYAVNHYLTDTSLLLTNVTSVSQSGEVLTITGHPDESKTTSATRKLLLLKGRGYNLSNTLVGWKLWRLFTWSKYPISLSTVPIKYRGQAAGPVKNQPIKAQAEGGVKNLGILISPIDYQIKKYRVDRPQSGWRITFGGWIAPAIYELDNHNTFPGTLNEEEEINQLFISVAAPTVTFVTNGIGIIIAPLGYDLAVNESGSGWVHAGHPWHGLGVGLEIKKLVEIFN